MESCTNWVSCTLIRFLKEFFKKVNFDESSADDSKSLKNYPACKELLNFLTPITRFHFPETSSVLLSFLCIFRTFKAEHIFRSSELNSPEHNMSLQTSNHSLDQPTDTKCTRVKSDKFGH